MNLEVAFGRETCEENHKLPFRALWFFCFGPFQRVKFNHVAKG